MYYTASAQNLFYNKFISRLYMFRAPRAHRQEVKNCIIQHLHKICFTISLFQASTCFEHHVIIIRKSKLYYTASAQNLFYNKFISSLYMFRAPCAHRQEVKNCIIQHMHKICFTISLFHASTCFEHHVLIVRRAKIVLYNLWYHHTYRWLEINLL